MYSSLPPDTVINQCICMYSAVKIYLGLNCVVHSMLGCRSAAVVEGAM